MFAKTIIQKVEINKDFETELLFLRALNNENCFSIYDSSLERTVGSLIDESKLNAKQMSTCFDSPYSIELSVTTPPGDPLYSLQNRDSTSGETRTLRRPVLLKKIDSSISNVFIEIKVVFP